MKRKRTEVTIETDEIWIIRLPGSGLVAWCPACCQQATMITPDEAALLIELDVRDIYRHVETGLIHHSAMPGGFLLVCANSIMRLSTDAADGT
jgi:hypothetical protein